MAESAKPAANRRARPTGSRRSRAADDPATTRARSDGSGHYRKGAATRQEILSAASVVFARRGYGGTRLEDIAAEAGMSRTSVYHYFESRLAILVEIGRVAIIAIHAVIDVARGVPTNWTRDDLARLIDAQIDYLDAHGAVIPIWTQAAWSDTELRDTGLEPQFNDFAAIGTELGRLRGTSDIDPIHDGIIFTGMIERLWYFAREGGAGTIDDTAMRRTLVLQLEAMLTRREPHS